ncbi:MAG: hypothetical protein ACK5LJ_08065 [Paracoccus sp. (in: a-proteobacteria)]
MNENQNSTSGMLEDLIRGMIQLTAMEVHAKTALEKTAHELSICEDSELEQVVEKEMVAEGHLHHVTELRRQAMRLIASYAPNLNPEKWCEVKHAAMAMYTIFEAYQADGKNQGLYGLYLDTNKLFISVVSDWLGLDIPPCAACFSDALKGES